MEQTEFNKEKIKKINYYCVDICAFDINNEILNKKITHYLNFAAVKHVRSEENILSIKYMVKTNSINFIKKKFIKKNNLKKVFSISTDKSANPSSILGITKKLMEQRLFNFKSNNHKIFVSSVRFANVSFSNGSILKYVLDRMNHKKFFGVPRTIRRYFITHDEASSLCLKSLLKRNDKMILTPNDSYLKKDYLITDLVSKILKINHYKPKYLPKINKKNQISKNYPVLLTNPNTHGQKYFEEFYENSENIFFDKKDKTISKVKLPNDKNVDQILNTVLKYNDINKIKNFLIKKFKSYKPPKKVVKVSQYL